MFQVHRIPLQIVFLVAALCACSTTHDAAASDAGADAHVDASADANTDARVDAGPPPTGAACLLEAQDVPVDGFQDSEVYLDNTDQCEGNACMVANLRGNPLHACVGAPGDPSDCVTQAAIDEHVFCTCRCDGAPGAGDFCECPGGFDCREVFMNHPDPSVNGSYCIRASIPPP